MAKLRLKFPSMLLLSLLANAVVLSTEKPLIEETETSENVAADAAAVVVPVVSPGKPTTAIRITTPPVSPTSTISSPSRSKVVCPISSTLNMPLQKESLSGVLEACCSAEIDLLRFPVCTDIRNMSPGTKGVEMVDIEHLPYLWEKYPYLSQRYKDLPNFIDTFYALTLGIIDPDSDLLMIATQTNGIYMITLYVKSAGNPHVFDGSTLQYPTTKRTVLAATVQLLRGLESSTDDATKKIGDTIKQGEVLVGVSPLGNIFVKKASGGHKTIGCYNIHTQAWDNNPQFDTSIIENWFKLINGLPYIKGQDGSETVPQIDFTISRRVAIQKNSNENIYLTNVVFNMLNQQNFYPLLYDLDELRTTDMVLMLDPLDFAEQPGYQQLPKNRTVFQVKSGESQFMMVNEGDVNVGALGICRLLMKRVRLLHQAYADAFTSKCRKDHKPTLLLCIEEDTRLCWNLVNGAVLDLKTIAPFSGMGLDDFSKLTQDQYAQLMALPLPPLPYEGIEENKMTRWERILTQIGIVKDELEKVARTILTPDRKKAATALTDSASKPGPSISIV